MEGAEDYVQCPYNRSHVIIKKRLQYHLSKCRRQSSSSTRLGVCPYNSTHVIPKHEMEQHQTTCPDRIVADSFIYSTARSSTTKDLVPVNLEIPVVVSAETWEDDPLETSVLDQIKTAVKEKPVLINLIGVTKSEKQAHKYQERMRYHQVVNEKNTQA